MPSSLTFGPFTLDVEGAVLRRNGDKVALRPKCFDLLVYLVAQPGKVITKDELLGRVWPDVVVNEGTLNRTVTELRAALGDDSDHPQYIETAPRRGYKFIAALSGRAGPSQPAIAGDFVIVHNGDQHPLREGQQLIGRGADAAIALFDSGTSRQHARIIVTGATVTLEDLGSRNGTYVNGQRVAGATELHTGDEIRIGSDVLILWARGSETASRHG